MQAVSLAALAFLLGSIPSGLVLTYLTTGRDIRRHGSGNIGAANVAGAAGASVGIAVGIFDLLKGVIPVLLGRWLGFTPDSLALVAAAAVLGHDFSLFLGFRGGKGVATTIGVALALSPVAGILTATSWLAVAVLSRYASVASLVALALLPVFLAVTGAPASDVWLGLGLWLLALAKHWENLLKLAHGREAPIGKPRRPDHPVT